VSFIYVTEAPELRVFQGGGVQAIELPALAQQQVANAGASTQSAAFQTKTRVIEVHSDSICSIAIGANPTAVVTQGRLRADETRYYRVRPGDKIAAVLAT
jgi:hypothetical protein